MGHLSKHGPRSHREDRQLVTLFTYKCPLICCTAIKTTGSFSKELRQTVTWNVWTPISSRPNDPTPATAKIFFTPPVIRNRKTSHMRSEAHKFSFTSPTD